jgi:hypothetical protein
VCYSQYHLAARPVPTEVLEKDCLISGGDPGATVTGELAPGVGVLASLPEDTPSVSIYTQTNKLDANQPRTLSPIHSAPRPLTFIYKLQKFIASNSM